jgi:outer membrane protein TolC
MTILSMTILLLLLLTPLPAMAEQLTLTTALARAATNNRTLKVAAFDERIATENITIHRSGYLPRVDIQGGYTAQLEPQGISVNNNSFTTQQADYGFFSLAVNQTLYDFGRTDARLSRARATRDATRLSYRGQEQEVFLQVVAAYFRILQTGKQLKAADDEIAQMTDHQRVAQQLYEQGVVTRNDLLQAEVRLAGSRQQRLEIANRLVNNWLWLNHLTGSPAEFRADLGDDTKIDLTVIDSPPHEAITGRTELQAQQKLLEAGELEVDETRSSFYPEIYAKLGLDYVENDRVREQAIMAATVGLKMNLFDGNSTTARHRQAVQSRTRAAEQLRKIEADLELEYRTAVNDARVAAERITVAELAITQAEENLRINKDRYLEQVGTATAVIDAQTLLTGIRSDVFQAVFDYEVSLARVKRARGEL